MAVLSLPLSFNNSFWSQDYRRGLEVLYNKLAQGTQENDEILAFIRARAVAESQLAASLSSPALTGSGATGFGADDGASLLMTFRGLQAEATSQGQVHANISKELQSLVADPFEHWAHNYKERLSQSKATLVDGHLASYEEAQAGVTSLKQEYHDKTRKADEAFDDAKFAPNSGGVDNYTTSPRLRPMDAPHKPRAPPQRTASVSERIANRLKEIQKRSAGAIAAAAAAASEQEKLDETIFAHQSPTETEHKVDEKGKGKEVEHAVSASPSSLSPLLTPTDKPVSLSKLHPPAPPSPVPPGAIPATPIHLTPSFAIPPEAVSQLLQRAAKELPLRPVRFPLLGEYPQCFTGEEFVDWLLNNVAAFENDWEKAYDGARILVEKERLLRRVGELGNAWEATDDSWFQFRPKAFELGTAKANVSTPISPIGGSPNDLLKSKPITSFASLVSKALSQANSSEPAHLRARREADAADADYKLAVRRLDRQRLGLEERIEETLKILQRWEAERLSAVKTCLLQFQGTLSNLPNALAPSLERSSTLISAYQPEADLKALIERYRTGPFRPHAVLYESVSHDERDVLFGGDLRRWSEALSGSWSSQVAALSNGEKPKDPIPIPLVLERLFEGLDEAYKRVEKDEEKRRAWIYEVPLPAIHHLRERLNSSIPPPGSPKPNDTPEDATPQNDVPVSLISSYDAPVIAATIKLWLLELDPPIGMWESWDDFRKIYPSVGSSQDGDENKEKRIADVSAALLKLPKVHLQVLDRVVGYLVHLMESTTSEESNEVYITKLALSVGRTIVRPKQETELSVQDRHPASLFVDLLKSYSAILPPTMAKKKKESERKVPIRKRTAPIDMRISRSKMLQGANDDQQKEQMRMLHAQHVRQNPSISRRAKSPPVPPVPSIPRDAKKEEPSTAPAPTQAQAPATVPAPAPTPPAPETPKPEAKPMAEVKDDTPRPPAFKEPPPEPEDETLPPRPAFKEPPPEPKDEDLPPRPAFKEPPPEPASPSTETPPTAASDEVPKADEDQPLGNGSPSLGRNSGGQTAGVRGPRMAPTRGPRAPHSPGSGSRPSSVLGRASAFERRTMESDAEDNVVGK